MEKIRIENSILYSKICTSVAIFYKENKIKDGRQKNIHDNWR